MSLMIIQGLSQWRIGFWSRRSLAIKEKQLGAEHPEVAQSLLNLAVLYHQTQRPAEALKAIQRAIQIYTQTLGQDHPTTQNALSWLQLIQNAL